MSSFGEVREAQLSRSIRWSAIIAGAIVAAGISFALHAFALGVGLAAMSAAPTWRDSTAWLWVVSGLYLLFVAICAFAAGGYIAGRFHSSLTTAAGIVPDRIESGEMEYRDGLHGLVMWGLAIVMTAVMALGVAATTAPAVAPSGSAGASQSVAGENIIASELDELFRSDRDVPNIMYRRAEAARILLKASSHAGISRDDRNYLTLITANGTGLALDRAEVRVDRVIGEVRDELRKARIAAILQACFVGVAIFVGAAVAWFAAVEGGRDREAGLFPHFDWSFRRRAVPVREASSVR